MNTLEIAKEVFEKEAQAILDLAKNLDENFNQAVNLMLNTKGRCIVSGMGKSGHIGAKIAATLASTGTPSFFIHPGEALHGDLGMLTPEDVLIAISNSGETEEILKIIPAIKKRKKYSSYQGEVGKIASNLIKRNFKADKPYTKLFTDVSEFNLNGYKLYLSPFIDGFNQEIVGFSIGKSPNMRLVMESLNQAILKGQKEGADFSKTIIHSDQGWQYQNKNFRLRLNDSKIIQSMSRKGNCNDNGLMEGFFGLLKNEMFYGKEKTFSSIEDLKNKIEDYIDFYNNRRIKTGLNALSPVDYKKVKAQASKKV